MEIEFLVRRLEQNGQAILALTTAVSDQQARWKPTPDAWSILEVINHLFDEEREDFRQRFKLLLDDPNADWPAIDPDGWITSRDYNSRGLAESQQNFLQERQASLVWLQSLINPPLDNVKIQHGHRMSAKQMAYNWLAHDQLHIRQLAELHHQWAEAQSAPESVDYAGGW